MKYEQNDKEKQIECFDLMHSDAKSPTDDCFVFSANDLVVLRLAANLLTADRVFAHNTGIYTEI